MTQYFVRQTITALLTLVLISFIIFAVLDLAPGDPTAGLAETVRPEVLEQMRAALGLDEPFHKRYLGWMHQFFVNESLELIEDRTQQNIDIKIGPYENFSANRVRVTSWNSRGKPVTELIFERLPQTLWVVGLAYIFAILIAIPLGVISAVRQNSIFDQISTVFSVIGFSMPTFVTGLLLIVIFSVELKWLPSRYDTTLDVTGWSTFLQQVKQMIMPVGVLAFFQTATLSRFTRSSMLENLNLDYVRTVRSKGFRERYIITSHVLRNSLIPVVTLIALGIPQIFAGAIITEQIFSVNGLGELLVRSVQNYDIPTLQTLTFMFAVLIVLFNLIADFVYAFLDPRISYS